MKVPYHLGDLKMYPYSENYTYGPKVEQRQYSEGQVGPWKKVSIPETPKP